MMSGTSRPQTCPAWIRPPPSHSGLSLMRTASKKGFSSVWNNLKEKASDQGHSCLRGEFCTDFWLVSMNMQNIHKFYLNFQPETLHSQVSFLPHLVASYVVRTNTITSVLRRSMKAQKRGNSSIIFQDHHFLSRHIDQRHYDVKHIHCCPTSLLFQAHFHM